jgi:hypothetical protein
MATLNFQTRKAGRFPRAGAAPSDSLPFATALDADPSNVAAQHPATTVLQIVQTSTRTVKPSRSAAVVQIGQNLLPSALLTKIVHLESLFQQKASP